MTVAQDADAFSEGTPLPATESAEADSAPSRFTPVPLIRRPTGWTAFRQRRFLDALAETGNVTAAAEEAGASVRSAYRLRVRPDGRSFAAAWDHALTLGARSLLDTAIHRATIGRPHGIWREGRLVGQEDRPSDRLLVFLLAHLQPTRFGRLSGLNPVPVPDAVEGAEAGLPALVDRLMDMDLPPEPDVHESFAGLWDEPDLPDDAPDSPAPSPALVRARERARRPPRPRTHA
jgi:hypothetical protein